MELKEAVLNGLRQGLAVLLACGLVAGGARAQEDGSRHAHGGGGGDRVGMFQTLDVGEDGAGDVACVFCTVHVDGTVHGDVAVLFGTVDVTRGNAVQGDLATLFSTLVLEDGTQVDGDVATLFGTAQVAPTAEIRGDRAIFSSRFGLEVILGGLLLMVGLIWLVVWGVRRMVLAR